MGVSGTGKSTVGIEVAEHLGWVFVEGDSLHPSANIAKMSAGIALDDDDRQPWLAAIASLMAAQDRLGTSSVLTCSALTHSYRDTLRRAVPEGSVFFAHLAAPFDVLRRRMEARAHFMPPSLLQSQFDTLEPLGPDEPGAVFDVRDPVAVVVSEVISATTR